MEDFNNNKTNSDDDETDSEDKTDSDDEEMGEFIINFNDDETDKDDEESVNDEEFISDGGEMEDFISFSEDIKKVTFNDDVEIYYVPDDDRRSTLLLDIRRFKQRILDFEKIFKPRKLLDVLIHHD